MKLLTAIVGGMVLCGSAAVAQNTKEKMMNTESDKIVIYQIFTRLFGNTKTTNAFNGSMEVNGCGKMNDISDKALSELKKFGVSHVWYTGIIEHATMTDFSSYGIKADNPEVVKGIAGSPYAIKDYYDVNPDLAVDVKNRIGEFEDLVKRSHANDLKVLIDFVPNHVARGYNSDAKPKGVKDFGETDDKTKSFDPNNNFYYIVGEDFKVPAEVKPPVAVKAPFVESPAKATGNDVFSAKPSINDWFETMKLNYGVDYLDNRTRHFDTIPSTWLKMRDILAYWSAKGVDGFRCDMAEMVPVEFWGWVIPEIKKLNPKVVFIAEIYNPNEYKNYIFNGKFDYLYDKVGLYDALRRLMEGHGNSQDITKVWQKESGDFANHMLRFLENHDEQRIASKYFANDPFVAIPAMTLSATLHTGPMMIYFGQEVGVNPTQAEGFQGEDGRTTIFDYWGVPEFQAWTNNGKFDGKKLTVKQKELRKFYADLNKLVVKNEAISSGKFYDLQYLNDYGKSEGYNESRIYSYLRYTDNQKLLFVYNFDKQNTYNTHIKLDSNIWYQVLKLKQKKEFQIKDIFLKKNKIKFSFDELINTGIPVELPPLTVQVFEIIEK